MSASYSYPLFAKVLSEFVGTTLTIFLGEGILANELLPSTKGHGMGFLAVAIGFGLAFGVVIAMLSFVSAHLNPGMFFFLALLGKVEWSECWACAAADFAGAFCGAVLVFVFYWPHFSYTLPQPSDANEVATYVEGPASLEKNAGRFASAFGPASHKRKGETLRNEIRGFLRSPNDDEHFLDHTEESRYPSVTEEQEALLDKMETRHKRRVAFATPLVTEGRSMPMNHSANLAALLHQHDPALVQSLLASQTIANTTNADPLRHSVQVAGLLHTHDIDGLVTAKKEETSRTSKNSTSMKSDSGEGEEISVTKDEQNGVKDDEGHVEQDEEGQQQQSQPTAPGKNVTPQRAAYQAALQADASAKLSIFGTRPAIYNRPWNTLQECLASTALFLGVELINLRAEWQTELTGAPTQDGILTNTLFVSLYIALLVLGVGGATGLAANPARDLGPRIAHAILPIPNKGSSEWHYGLVAPLWGPYLGAALGAAIYKGVEKVFEMVEVVEGTTSGTSVEL